MLDHYKGGAEGSVAADNTAEYAAHSVGIEGIVEALRMLKARNAGRYTREDRIAQQVLLSAATLKAGIKKMLSFI